MNDIPKLWRDMTSEEKGALLLAHHEGKAIEAMSYQHIGWYDANPTWMEDVAYRVKSAPPREIWLRQSKGWGWIECGDDEPDAIHVREVLP